MSQNVYTSSVSGGNGTEIVVVVPINQGASGGPGPAGQPGPPGDQGPPGPAYQFPPYAANLFQAGPSSGSPAVPTPRAIVVADLPSLSTQSGTQTEGLVFASPASGSGSAGFRELTYGDIGGSAAITIQSNNTFVVNAQTINVDPSLIVTESGNEVTIGIGAQPFAVSGFSPGPFTNDQVVFNWGLTVTGTFLADLPGSILTCDPGLTQAATCTVFYGGTPSGSTLVGGTSFGSIVFIPGNDNATVSSTQVSLTAPSNISMAAPGTAVSSLLNLTATIAGMRNAQ